MRFITREERAAINLMEQLAGEAFWKCPYNSNFLKRGNRFWTPPSDDDESRLPGRMIMALPESEREKLRHITAETLGHTQCSHFTQAYAGSQAAKAYRSDFSI